MTSLSLHNQHPSTVTGNPRFQHGDHGVENRNPHFYSTPQIQFQGKTVKTVADTATFSAKESENNADSSSDSGEKKPWFGKRAWNWVKRKWGELGTNIKNGWNRFLQAIGLKKKSDTPQETQDSNGTQQTEPAAEPQDTSDDTETQNQQQGKKKWRFNPFKTVGSMALGLVFVPAGILSMLGGMVMILPVPPLGYTLLLGGGAAFAFGLDRLIGPLVRGALSAIGIGKKK